MQHPRVGIACVVLNDGKILLGQRLGSHGQGSWAPPGGHLEFGESVADGAARELCEETGLKPLSLEVGPWVENIMKEEQKHYITLFVFIDRFEGSLSLLEPHKCKGWEWFDAQCLPRPLFSPIVTALKKDPHLFSGKGRYS
jgi:8-oxo-dGTP diphosphatase